MTKFHIEIPDGHGVPDDIMETVRMIYDDKTGSTLREWQLAYALLHVSAAMNRLVSQLNYGTAVVVTEEPVTRHDS